MEDKDRILQELKEKVRRGGGQARIDRQHELNKLTARERIDKILDHDSFHEIFSLASLDFSLAKQDGFGDGIIIGHGKIDGRLICIYSQDTTIKGGSRGPPSLQGLPHHRYCL